MKTLIISPAYNEAENIAAVVQRLELSSAKMDYIIINDCSRDDTSGIFKRNGYPMVSLPVNLGIGGGVQTGY